MRLSVVLQERSVQTILSGSLPYFYSSQLTQASFFSASSHPLLVNALISSSSAIRCLTLLAVERFLSFISTSIVKTRSTILNGMKRHSILH